MSELKIYSKPKKITLYSMFDAYQLTIIKKSFQNFREFFKNKHAYYYVRGAWDGDERVHGNRLRIKL